MDVYIGLIFPFAGTYAPQSTAQCWGQTLPANQYQALWALVGTLYGGDGVSTIGLPDLRGRTLIGMGASPYLTANIPVGASGGVAAITLNQGNLPLHTHGATFTPTGGGGSSTINATVTIPVGTSKTGTNVPVAGVNYLSGLEFSDGGAGGALSGPYTSTNPGNSAHLAGTATGSVTVSGSGGTVTVAAGGGVPAPNAFSNLQPYLAVTMFIVLQGLFPSRD